MQTTAPPEELKDHFLTLLFDKIMNHEREILDEFCKAFMAQKSLEGIPIEKIFEKYTLCTSIIDGKYKPFSGESMACGNRYWFEEKKPHEKTFVSEAPQTLNPVPTPLGIQLSEIRNKLGEIETILSKPPKRDEEDGKSVLYRWVLLMENAYGPLHSWPKEVKIDYRIICNAFLMPGLIPLSFPYQVEDSPSQMEKRFKSLMEKEKLK